MKRILPFAVMCVGMFLALLDIQIVASSLRDIAGGLSATQDEINWVQTAYLIAEIIVIPLSGWLTRLLSTRWLFAGSALGFTASSIMCGFAWSINSMIIFRAMQGLLGASMIPVVLTSAFIYFPGSKQVIPAAIIGALSFLAPTLGPILGGYITDTFNWHWLFYINLVPGTLIALLTIKWVDVDRPDLTLLRGADYIGIILMAVGLGSLEYLLEEGARWDWFSDDTITSCAYISFISLAVFIIRSLMIENPIMDFRALKDRNFLIGCILSFIVGIGIFSSTYLTPLFLNYVQGFSAWQTGIALFPSGVSS
ncbi:MAG: EmrB/QacA family drug resistance transporter, partial [Acidocella sp. 21-58-7]